MQRTTTTIIGFILWTLVSTVAVQGEVVIEMVTVGDPGNAADTRFGPPFGGVDYVFSIGKYEVTNAQYAEFLNAVAAFDPNGLYHENMGNAGTHVFGGITRGGSVGSYTYSAIEGRGNMPVNWVSWYDTFRFANWLHNGQPTGGENPSTTEDGAYDMSLGAAVVRKPGARVFLPDRDEWYKAAYYKGGSVDAGYWDYPTQTDTPPTCQALPGSDFVNGSANCDQAVGDLTYVGSYTAKPSGSAYGAFDQGGNVWEWSETGDGIGHMILGGGLYHDSSAMLAPPYTWDTTSGTPDYGFRVAAIPVLDFDGDGDVDLQDYAGFQAGFEGP